MLFKNKYRDLITPEEIENASTADKIKFYDTETRRNSNTKVAIATIVGALIVGIPAYIKREYDLDHMQYEECKIPDPVVNSLKFLQSDITYIGNELKANHNLCRNMYRFNLDIHRKLLPNQWDKDGRYRKQ